MRPIRLVSGFFTVGMWTLASRVLGFVRDILIAAWLGTGPAHQAFVIAFVRHHGSIKKMESLFGISYPTVKNRLNAIAARLDTAFEAPLSNSDILDQLARGEITVDEALARLD